jgi:hypothetical protein
MAENWPFSNLLRTTCGLTKINFANGAGRLDRCGEPAKNGTVMPMSSGCLAPLARSLSPLPTGSAKSTVRGENPIDLPAGSALIPAGDRFVRN